jgi:hypothetical protein
MVRALSDSLAEPLPTTTTPTCSTMGSGEHVS